MRNARSVTSGQVGQVVFYPAGTNGHFFVSDANAANRIEYGLKMDHASVVDNNIEVLRLTATLDPTSRMSGTPFHCDS
jgi:hypothetical protein